MVDSVKNHAKLLTGLVPESFVYITSVFRIYRSAQIEARILHTRWCCMGAIRHPDTLIPRPKYPFPLQSVYQAWVTLLCRIPILFLINAILYVIGEGLKSQAPLLPPSQGEHFVASDSTLLGFWAREEKLQIRHVHYHTYFVTVLQI